MRALLRMFLVLTFFSLSSAAMNEQTKKGLNIAVTGGGGVNSYASLVLAVKLAKQADAPFHTLFDQVWSISGGTIPAKLLMSKKFSDEETIELFKKTVGEAFPNPLLAFLDPTDKEGTRRQKFEKELAKHFGDLSFGAQKNNNVVFIGSAKGKPVYFCDPEISLPSTALRCLEGTPCIKGIVSSSCFKLSAQSCLFKEESLALLPEGEEEIVVDGGHCDNKDKYMIDGFTPTPLVIEYLIKIPGHHNVVVLDNGGPINEEFRKSIGVDENGIATITFEEGTITVYFITISVENFQLRSVMSTSQNLEYLEQQVAKAIGETSVVPFIAAVSAVTGK